jgi:hypothetical protein
MACMGHMKSTRGECDQMYSTTDHSEMLRWALVAECMRSQASPDAPDKSGRSKSGRSKLGDDEGLGEALTAQAEGRTQHSSLW